MEGEDAESSNSYVNNLETNFVYLDEYEHDKLIWSRNAINGDYTAKKGYEVEILEQFEGEKY